MLFDELVSENTQLRQQLEELQRQREDDKARFESQVELERERHQSSTNQLHERGAQLEDMMTRLVRVTRQLDSEVMHRDRIQADSSLLERTAHDLAKEPGAVPSPAAAARKRVQLQDQEQAAREQGQQVSTKLMRVVDQWMRQKDLQQALLRNAAIKDEAFGTLVQALMDCPSLQTLDLSQNLLTMDRCSDLCQLLTTAPLLSFVSLAENLLSLRSVGYFMTAVMERQGAKRLAALDLLDLSGNEGLVAAAAAPCPERLRKQVQEFIGSTARLPDKAVDVLAQVTRCLWRFLHDTDHPQVRGTDSEEVAFDALEPGTLGRMEQALMKILLMSQEGGDKRGASLRPVTGNLALPPSVEAKPVVEEVTPREGGRSAPGTAGKASASGLEDMTAPDEGEDRPGTEPGKEQGAPGQQRAAQLRGEPFPDPFAHLRFAAEKPREKLKTFNLKQIVTRKGTVLMNMLERLLEVTDINAHDVETEQTLLEFACRTGNMQLAKLCCRRGANLNARTSQGETVFNIVTQLRRYDMMEFLHTYGMQVNSCDAEGLTPLHVAAANDDVDAVCRLLEWGADVNACDHKQRGPIHMSASCGNSKTTMLLLEVGANMNAKDAREYTAVAHAEAKNHFALMDRLVQLGGKGHGLQAKQRDMGRARSAKQIGELVVSAGMLKSSSLGRIGKVPVKGMSGPLTASLAR